MALDRVSFAKPLEARPRLSEKYEPGIHSKRFWTEAEKQILRDHVETKGAQYCRGLLPGRGTQGIYQMASKLGLAVKGGLGQRRQGVHKNSPELDARIREEWSALTGSNRTGEVARLADRLDVPRWWLSKRATALGLTLPRVTKEPPWSVAELELLKRVPLHDPHVASRMFREHGFLRTPSAIMVKSKRAGISCRYKETLSATAAAKILGVDAKTFTRWIIDGVIQATKRETKRLPQQGGNPWSIERVYFRQWINDNVERIDFRKVDKFALVEILTLPVPA